MMDRVVEAKIAARHPSLDEAREAEEKAAAALKEKDGGMAAVADEAAAKERIKNHMDSHLAAEFPEVFAIKKLIVLGEIGPEIAETYAAFGAEIRTKIGGFS